MAVESPADLAGFFEEEEFAEEAGYLAPGAGVAVSCLVIVDRGQGRTGFEAARGEIASAERRVTVRASELSPVRGGRFTLAGGAEVLEVMGSPVLDHTGAVYNADVVIRD